MKGIGWIVVLLGLLGVTFLLVRDLGVLTGAHEGQTVVQPLQRAKEVADLVRSNQEAVRDGVERTER